MKIGAVLNFHFLFFGVNLLVSSFYRLDASRLGDKTSGLEEMVQNWHSEVYEIARNNCDKVLLVLNGKQYILNLN